MPARAALARIVPPFTGPTANRTLDSHLSFWLGWEIRARCGTPLCRSNRLLCVGDVLGSRGDITLREMADRLRCSVCGEAAHSVALLQQGPSGPVIHPVRGGASSSERARTVSRRRPASAVPGPRRSAQARL